MTRINQSGMTIVELLVSITIAGILATVLLAVSLTFFGNTIRGQVTSEMIVDSHFALRAITEDLRLGDSIAVTNSLPDANAPGGGWATSSADSIIVINSPSVTADNQVIYDDSTGNPYDNEFVYFVSNNQLYKRQLKNDAAVGNDISTSCPEALAGSGCPSDRKYTSFVDSFSFVMYDNLNNEVADPALARSVKVDISMSRKVFGQTVSFDNSILTKLRN